MKKKDIKAVIKKIRQSHGGMLKRFALSNTKNAFVFCESINASGISPWHIRKLTDKGLKLGGGADTDTLCGREMAWDLNVDITEHHLTHCCKKCAEVFNGSF